MIWAGACLLIISCGGLGLYMASRIRKRPEELRACLTALTLLDTEISWGVTPLPEAFGILKERTEKPWSLFFAELEKRLQKGEGAYKAWNDTIAQQMKYFCLKPEDWQVIKDVGKGLGRSDRQEQHKQIELVKQQLALIREDASEWAEKQAKMWSYLGFLGGIAGVLFLI